MSDGPLLAIAFDSEVIHWRGPAPFFFAPVPREHAAAIKAAARIASYGWGVVPVTVAIGGASFTTSLFPRDGSYLVPLKDAVRAETGVSLGDPVTVEIEISLPFPSPRP
ncbi:MAG: DUF1905 domain-containing protein [Sphingomonas sp.]|nr:DUF1905 domain-containing protein [Sphingomonas sp.]